MANIFDDEKFLIDLPFEEEEEKNHDENIEADILRKQEPVKIADEDLGLQTKNQYLIPLSLFFRMAFSTSQKSRSDNVMRHREIDI